MTVNLHQISHHSSSRRYKQNWKVGNPLVWRDAHQVVTQAISLKKIRWRIILYYLCRYCILKWKTIRYHNICALCFQSVWNTVKAVLPPSRAVVLCHATEDLPVWHWGIWRCVEDAKPCGIKLEECTAQREPNLLQPCPSCSLGIHVAWAIP